MIVKHTGEKMATTFLALQKKKEKRNWCIHARLSMENITTQPAGTYMGRGGAFAREISRLHRNKGNQSENGLQRRKGSTIRKEAEKWEDRKVRSVVNLETLAKGPDFPGNLYPGVNADEARGHQKKKYRTAKRAGHHQKKPPTKPQSRRSSKHCC